MNHSSPDSRAGWSATTRLVVGILLIILLALALSAFRAILVPLIISMIVAYLMHPVVEFVSHRTRIPHKVATALIYLILLAGVIPRAWIGQFQGLPLPLATHTRLPSTPPHHGR